MTVGGLKLSVFQLKVEKEIGFLPLWDEEISVSVLVRVEVSAFSQPS
jgi:hypothetical protein